MKKLLFTFLTLFICLSCGSCTSKEYEPSDYMLDLDYCEDFTILQLSDIHIANKDDRDRQYKFIGETIDMAKEKHSIGLIVLTGDNFTFGTKTVAKELFSFLDSYEIPWTITWGNHDEQCYFSIDWVTGYLNNLSKSTSSYCMFIDHQDDNVTGNANFVINLKENDVIKEQVYIIDSLRYNYGFDYIGYDYIKQDQIDWYNKMCNYSKSLNNDTAVHSVMFMHIPFPEFETAWNMYESDPTSITNYIEGSVNGDGCQSVPKYNSGMFTAIKNNGSTDGVFVGHDHKNNWILKYEGIYLGYGVTSSDRIYFSEDLLGASTYTIKADNSLEFDQIIRSYSEYE